MERQIAVMLHNVRSAHNVGAIFRTADAAGVEKIYLTGYTPTPKDRFGRTQANIVKTALGAEETVPWEYAASASRIIARLRRKGWQSIGVEQDARSRQYRTYKVRRPALFVFGNEVKGLSRTVRRQCDILLEIPMRGAMVWQAHHPRRMRRGKESLNVSVAAGIILFHAAHERKIRSIKSRSRRIRF